MDVTTNSLARQFTRWVVCDVSIRRCGFVCTPAMAAVEVGWPMLCEHSTTFIIALMDRLKDYSLDCNIVVSACRYLQWSNPSTPACRYLRWSNPSTPAYSRPSPSLVALTTLQPSPRGDPLSMLTGSSLLTSNWQRTPHKDKFAACTTKTAKGQNNAKGL